MTPVGGYTLAVDVGTSMIKAAALDPTGTTAARSATPSPVPGPGGVDPDEVWERVCLVLREISTVGLVPDAIVITGQGDGLWRIDAEGRGLPAHQWNSSNGADVIRRWADDGTVEAHYRSTGTVLWPGTAAALWRWLTETDPQEAARTASFFTVKDWVSYRLTGVVATDVTDATIPFLDPRTGEYSGAAFERLGCSALIPMAPPVLAPGAVLGPLTRAASEATGVPAGTPVHVGCLDVVAMLRGIGLVAGEAMAVLGTTISAVAVSADLDLDGEPAGAVVRLGDGTFMRLMAAVSGTTTLEWFLTCHGYDGPDRHARFWQDVRESRPGVVLLPYLAGERAPFLEPDATGVFAGITLTTTRGELARATVEGLTFALRLGLEAAGAERDRLVVTGGGASSPEWLQLLADVTGTPAEVDSRSDASLRGVASLVTGSAGEPAGGEVYQPGTEVARLEAGYARFRALLAAMRTIWHNREVS